LTRRLRQQRIAGIIKSSIDRQQQKMDVYDLALKRTAELEAELADLRAFLRTYAKLAPRSESTPASSRPASTVASSTADASRSKKSVIEAAVRDLLQERQPLMVPAILAALQQRGIDVGGTEPERNLSTYLSRSSLFEIRRKEGGWFLASEKQSAPDGGNQAEAEDDLT
jgi:hypothetical protein